MTVQHPEGALVGAQRATNGCWKAKGVFRDEGRSVRAVLIVDRNHRHLPRIKSVNGGVNRGTKVETNVMIPLSLEEFGGVHCRPMFVVASDRIRVRSRPPLGARPGKIVNPVRPVEHDRRMKRKRTARVHGSGKPRIYLRFRRTIKA